MPSHHRNQVPSHHRSVTIETSSEPSHHQNQVQRHHLSMTAPSEPTYKCRAIIGAKCRATIRAMCKAIFEPKLIPLVVICPLRSGFRIRYFHLINYSSTLALQVPCVPNWCFSTPTPCYRIVDSAYNNCTSFATNNIEMDTDIELNRSEL